MNIETNKYTSWSVFFIAVAAAFIVLVTQIGSCGRHTRSQIVKAKTCEQVVALSGGGIGSTGVLLCQKESKK
jgi:hypothetical protein